MNDETVKPHYFGHRARLKEKFLKNAEAIADYEVLELLLGYAIPRKDVKPIAKDLLSKFNNFAGVLGADIEELSTVQGIRENTAAFLKLVKEAHVRALKSKILKKDILASWDDIIDFCRTKIGHEKEESLHLLWMNKQLELIEVEEHMKGTVDAAVIYPAEIARRALNLRAKYIILVHNHPTGKLKPSQEDIDATNDIRNALFSVGVKLFDHLIICTDGYYSFKDKGLI